MNEFRVSSELGNSFKKAGIGGSDDIYSIFCLQLFNKLKRRVDASVHVGCDDDILTVNINKGPFSYKYQFPQLGANLMSGMTASALEEMVVSDYKNFILKLFFY